VVHLMAATIFIALPNMSTGYKISEKGAQLVMPFQSLLS
jgi:hypothetical protein